MQFVTTEHSGKGVSHYSAGIIHNGLLYISGQISKNPATGTIPDGGIIPETKQALENMELVLKAAGVEKTDVIQCRIYTPDIEYWGDINATYAEFFGSHKPARCIIPCTPLHFGCLVEIEAIAVCEK